MVSFKPVDTIPVRRYKGGRPELPLGERLLKDVEYIGDCWVWKGKSYTPDGRYGKIGVGTKEKGNKKSLLVHRVAYEVFKGPIPVGLSVCHTCDVTLCIRPDHLFTGTHNENMQDAVDKGRIPKGVDAHPAKLNDAKVRTIRQLVSEGYTYVFLAKMYGVNRNTIKYAVIRRTWKHVW